MNSQQTQRRITAHVFEDIYINKIIIKKPTNIHQEAVPIHIEFKIGDFLLTVD